MVVSSLSTTMRERIYLDFDILATESIKFSLVIERPLMLYLGIPGADVGAFMVDRLTAFSGARSFLVSAISLSSSFT